MKLLSGSSNLPFSQKLSAALKLPLEKIELSRFENGETRVYIPTAISDIAIIIQSLSHPTDHHLIELCLIADALKRHGSKQILAVIPWFGYSKQDKVFRPGEPLSIQVIADILQTVSIDQVASLDLHSQKVIDHFSIPIINLDPSSLFADFFTTQQLISQKSLVVSPDAGGASRSTTFAKKLHLPIAYIEKQRDLVSGQVSIKSIDQNVKGKHIIIYDDIIATGSTLINISQFLTDNQAASVTVAATHHLYLPRVQTKLDASSIDRLVVSDSVLKPQNLKSPKLSVITASDLFASELLKLVR